MIMRRTSMPSSARSPRHRSVASRRPTAATVLCGIALVVFRIGIPGTVTVNVPVSSKATPANPVTTPIQGCTAAYAGGFAAFEKTLNGWQSSLTDGHLIADLGKAANRAMGHTLAIFDRKSARHGGCLPQRGELEAAVRKEIADVTKRSRALAENSVAQEMRKSLLSDMYKHGGRLRVQEKMRILRDAAASYREFCRQLLPAWDEKSSSEMLKLEDEYGETERRLGKMQYDIEVHPDASALKSSWERKKSREVLSQRAHGVSVSVDPALRIMLRPDGIGNFQVYSEGPVGPPERSAMMNVGIMNDGSIADVYREHPTPPLVAVQPAVNVNLNVR